MNSFSQRIGLTPIKVNIQRESIDLPLLNALWNTIFIYYFKDLAYNLDSMPRPLGSLMYRLWIHHYNRRIDEIDNGHLIKSMVRDEFFREQWFKVFDILEFIPNNYEESEYNGGYHNKLNEEFCLSCNDHLVKHLSAYRFVNLQIVEMSSEEEISSIEESINGTATNPVKIHLRRALELYSDRNNPDYRNSIKESISAVESYAKHITGDDKATLGKALAVIERKLEIHGSLKTAFNALYGFTSDANGIRHALMDVSKVYQADAKFILVACSAFINYLTVLDI